MRGCNMKGRLVIEVFDKNGKLKQKKELTNYTFNENKTDFVKTGVSKITQIGIGLDNTAGSPDDTPTLKNILREENCVNEQEGDYTVKSWHTFTYFDATYDIWEIGLKLSNGKYLTRAVLDEAVTVDPDNNIKVTYYFTVE